MPGVRRTLSRTLVVSSLTILAAGALAAVAACPRSAIHPTYTAPAPGVSRDSLLAQARRLKWVTDTMHHGAHLAALAVCADTAARSCSCDKGQCVYGPLVWIQAESTAYRQSTDDLARGSYVARFINTSGRAYRKLALAPYDTVYWWVDRTKSGWRSVYLSTRDTTRSIDSSTAPLVLKAHPFTWPAPLSFWLWRPTDDDGWTTCSSNTCCTSAGLVES